jgi:hypothetical protein
MTTEQESKAANGRAANGTPGFQIIALSGGGRASALSVMRQHQAAGAPFPLYTTAIDTDSDGLEAFDSAISLALTREKVSAMVSNPRRYGPACQAIVRQHPHLLETETLGRGARTHRLLTQIACELFEPLLIEGLRKAIHAILKQGPFARIHPVVLASEGGGTGSAGVVLLLDYLAASTKKNRLMLGLPPDLVAKPTAFLIGAYAHALQQRNDVAPDWILANLYAMRAELAEYEKQGKGYEYVFHLGLGNDAGAVFPTIEQVCEVNGLIAWAWMANYAGFKSCATDTLDFYKDTCRYGGDDTPEALFPKHERPPYAAQRPDSGPEA